MKKRILLVDNEEIMAQTITLALKRFGFEVSCFTDNLEALEDFKLHSGEFDLIIAEESLPGRADRLAEEMIRVRPDIPVILYGYNSMDEGEAKTKGIRKFLLEPFSLDELGEAVRHILLGS